MKFLRARAARATEREEWCEQFAAEIAALRSETAALAASNRRIEELRRHVDAYTGRCLTRCVSACEHPDQR